MIRAALLVLLFGVSSADAATLIVTVCDDRVCERHRFPARDEISCLFGAQAEVARELQLRGDQRITRMECEA